MNYPLFDAHLHIIDPKFPLIANQGYLPPAFTTEQYQTTCPKSIIGGAVVSGSFQAFDQSYLLDALQKLGPNFVGVTQIPQTYTDQQILELATNGVRAVRFNLYRGGSEGLESLEYLAKRVYELAQWHIELYIDSATIDDSLMSRLSKLPQIVIDHLGLSSTGLPNLLKLVETGAKVKATGFSRVSLDIPQALIAITQANPYALMFGTDLPCTRAPKPFSIKDIELIVETLGEKNSHLVLSENAKQLYKPKL